MKFVRAPRFQFETDFLVNHFLHPPSCAGGRATQPPCHNSSREEVRGAIVLPSSHCPH